MSGRGHRDPDVVVVGGGPAGMMAAGRAAERGAKVLLVEKTYRLGSKLLITGGGRCNITNSAGMKEFIAAFGKNGRFLYRALTVFSNTDLIAFFAARGLGARVDPDGKVFPVNDSAAAVLAVLRAWLEENRVRIRHNTAVAGIVVEDGEPRSVRGVRLADGTVLKAGRVIVATGGVSYPKTGSSGDGYAFARECGHTVAPPAPGLVPLVSDEPFIRDLQGLALRDVAISVLADGKRVAGRTGTVLFTHFGVSGPDVLILSGVAADALAAGRAVALSVNLRPEVPPHEFARLLQKEFESCGTKTLAGYLREALPASLAPVFERLCGVPGDKRCSTVNREERARVAARFTDLRVTVTGTRPVEEATVTRGGVALKELDPRTMESRLVAGLYFCGETIDLDGITGGYNLQEAFSTGRLAGEAAAEKDGTG